jgi:hypothetical protein
MVCTTDYTECHAFSPVVRIGSPQPLTRKRLLLLPPFDSKGEAHSLAGEGLGEGPNSDEGTDALVLYV